MKFIYVVNIIVPVDVVVQVVVVENRSNGCC